MYFTCHIAYLGSPRKLDHDRDQAAIRCAVKNLKTSFAEKTLPDKIFITDTSRTSEWFVCVVYFWNDCYQSLTPYAIEAKEVLHAYPLHVFFSEDVKNPLPSEHLLSPSPPIVSVLIASQDFRALKLKDRHALTSTFEPTALNKHSGSGQVGFWFKNLVFLALIATKEDASIKSELSRYTALQSGRDTLVSAAPLPISLTPLWKGFLNALTQKSKEKIEEIERMREMFAKNNQTLSDLRKETATLALTKDRIQQEIGERRSALKGLKDKVMHLKADLETIKTDEAGEDEKYRALHKAYQKEQAKASRDAKLRYKVTALSKEKDDTLFPSFDLPGMVSEIVPRSTTVSGGSVGVGGWFDRME